MKAPLSPNEAQRLEALKGYNVLDTLPEQDFDNLALLAQQICQAPIALISLVDENRQWFKAKVGVSHSETPLEFAFCPYAILNPDEMLIVQDAQKDPRFFESPRVTGGPKIRFYAGAPLVTSDGFALGTLCVIDRVPRELSDEQKIALRTLSRTVITQLELRRTLELHRLTEKQLQSLNASLEQKVDSRVAELRREMEARLQSEQNLRQAQEIAHVGSWTYDMSAQLTWSDELYRIYGVSPVTFTPNMESFINLIHPDDRPAMQAWINVCNSGQKPGVLEFRCVWPDGSVHYISGQGRLVFDADGKPDHISGIAQDITERKRAEAQIEHLAYHDQITHLPNRLLLLDRLRQALVSRARNGRLGALLFIDLDNFKTLNDTLGHDIGDLLLLQVAKRLESCVREGDTVARLGGDEFVVMLLELNEQPVEAAAQTEAIGKKILASISQPYQLDRHTYSCTASVGATLFSDNQQASDELMKQADIAMYQAKKGGRNTLRFFDPKMQENISARVSLERELQNAIEFKQFHLYYQIQVDSTHRRMGAEALIRWAHPERGLVLPAQFIPLAEETGLIIPIGQWVLETACAQIKAWEKDMLARDLFLAVNVSAKQFRQTNFVAQVQAAVQLYDINPTLLKLEITESLLLENIEETIAIMTALNESGVQFSLDDFGTGYSSLQYLKRLPLDQLKIDQSFIRDIVTDSSDVAVVRATIAMARSLNLTVIAEGVETDEQRQLLLKNGCLHYQGYLFGKPVPIEQFEALLKQGQVQMT